MLNYTSKPHCNGFHSVKMHSGFVSSRLILNLDVEQYWWRRASGHNPWKLVHVRYTSCELIYACWKQLMTSLFQFTFKRKIMISTPVLRYFRDRYWPCTRLWPSHVVCKNLIYISEVHQFSVVFFFTNTLTIDVLSISNSALINLVYNV